MAQDSEAITIGVTYCKQQDKVALANKYRYCNY